MVDEAAGPPAARDPGTGPVPGPRAERPPPEAPYRDATRSVGERVEDLLARMDDEEKVAQLVGLWVRVDADAGEVAPFQAEFFGAGEPVDLDAATRSGLGQVTRPLGSMPVEPREGARGLNALQRRMVEETRLGIPVLAHEECLAGYMALGATGFPAPLSWGASWDPTLPRRIGEVIRRQMRAVGAHQGLAPVADVIRDARWGRVEECVSEDPYLVGTMVSAYVEGLQGPDRRTGVVATLKHFAGYSASAGGRNFAPADLGPRELADVHLVPFEMAVKEAGCASVMNAYHANDGVPCTASVELLTGVLRERWGFTGTVVSDYFSVAFLRVLHGVAADDVDAAAQALHAGIDVELPSPQCYPHLGEALERGSVTGGEIDRAVRRVLTQKFELGLFEDPYVDEAALAAGIEQEPDRALVREVADASLVLLKNDPPVGDVGADPLLPLSPELGRIAVIGPTADDPRALFGNYSFQNHVASHFPDRDAGRPPVTVLDAIRLRSRGDVLHAAGCSVSGGDVDGIPEAVAVAERADVAVVVVGDRAGHFGMGTVGEGTDRDDLSLPGVQERLVESVAATGTPTAVVLVHGRPFALGAVAACATSVLTAWFPGQEGGAAVADALFGLTNPGGRSPVTFTTGVGQMPRSHRETRLTRGVPGLSWTEPVFCFGHGLSYTSFGYDAAEVPATVPVDGEITVACTVTNTGALAGDEVVQLYVHDEVASVPRPLQQLVGYVRVHLEPGAAARVTFAVPTDLLAFTGRDLQRVVEPGAVRVQLGASSADIRIEETVELTGAVRVVGEDRRLRSTVGVEPR